MKIRRIDGSIIWQCEEEITLLEAIKRAYLGGADLGGADLRGAYLRDANLRDANLRGAYLGGADLRDANLRGAYLGGADLRDANLRGAYLGGADLGGADLGGADLGGADLRGAYLRDANLRGADLRDATAVIDGGQPNGWPTYAYEFDGELLVRVGCRTKEISEGRAYWSSDRHPNKNMRREVMAALDYMEAIAKLRGWKSAGVL